MDRRPDFGARSSFTHLRRALMVDSSSEDALTNSLRNFQNAAVKMSLNSCNRSGACLVPIMSHFSSRASAPIGPERSERWLGWPVGAVVAAHNWIIFPQSSFIIMISKGCQDSIMAARRDWQNGLILGECGTGSRRLGSNGACVRSAGGRDCKVGCRGVSQSG